VWQQLNRKKHQINWSRYRDERHDLYVTIIRITHQAAVQTWYKHGTNIRIRAITKLPNTEQSPKVKGKTHKSTNRQNQSTTGKLGKRFQLSLYIINYPVPCSSK